MTLNEWRTANRYTKAAFARLLNGEGVKADRTHVWHWENGTKPRKAALAAISKVTGAVVRFDGAR